MSTLNVTNITAADGTSGLSSANSTGLVTASKEVIQTDYMIDQWRLASNYGVNDSVISAGWERPDDPSYGRIGTGMTQSSGVFTFPTTGVYLVTFHVRFNIEYSDTFAEVQLKVSTDGGSSSDVVATVGKGSTHTATGTYHGSISALVNVTNASNFQVFTKTASMEGGNTEVRAHTDENQTMLIFERKGPAQ